MTKKYEMAKDLINLLNLYRGRELKNEQRVIAMMIKKPKNHLKIVINI